MSPKCGGVFRRPLARILGGGRGRGRGVWSRCFVSLKPCLVGDWSWIRFLSQSQATGLLQRPCWPVSGAGEGAGGPPPGPGRGPMSLLIRDTPLHTGVPTPAGSGLEVSRRLVEEGGLGRPGKAHLTQKGDTAPGFLRKLLCLKCKVQMCLDDISASITLCKCRPWGRGPLKVTQIP